MFASIINPFQISQKIFSAWFNPTESTSTIRQIVIVIGKNAANLNPDNRRLLKVSYAGEKVTEVAILHGKVNLMYKGHNRQFQIIDPLQILAIDSEKKDIIVLIPRHIF